MIGWFLAWVVPHSPWMTPLWFELYARSPGSFPDMLQVPVETRLLNPPETPEARMLYDLLLPQDTGNLSAGLWIQGLRDSAGWGMAEGWLVVPAGDFHLSWNARVVRSDTPRVYPARVWTSSLSGHRKLTGDLMTGAASYTRGSLWLMVGRSPLILGGDLASALMLGPSGPPLDMLFGTYRYRNLRGFFAVSGLDAWRLSSRDAAYYPDAEPGDIFRRYLSVHGLEYVTERFRLRLSEIVLYTGKNRPPEAHYLNPFYFYLAGHFNRGGLDNISWDLSLHAWFGRTLFFGELYIDDAQYETPPTREPDQLAWVLGAFHPRGPWSVLARYTRVNAWTYLHEGSFQNWGFQGFPMGHPLGPDVEEILLEGSHLRKGLRISARAWIRNKGENTIHTPWPVYPGGPSAFPSGSHFMWGVVEHRVGGALEGLFWSRRYWIGAEVRLDAVTNAGHQVGVNRTETAFRLHAGFRLP